MFFEIHIHGYLFKRFSKIELPDDTDAPWQENARYREQVTADHVANFRDIVAPYYHHEPTYELYMVFESKMNNDENSIFSDQTPGAGTEQDS